MFFKGLCIQLCTLCGHVWWQEDREEKCFYLGRLRNQTRERARFTVRVFPVSGCMS